MCSTVNFPLRRSSEALAAPGRPCGGASMTSNFAGPDTEMDVAWQELMAITELQELEPPGEGSFATAQYQTYENTVHMGGYGTPQPDPSSELAVASSYGCFSHQDCHCSNAEAVYGHTDDQLGHMASSYPTNLLMAPREHVSGLRVSLCPPQGLSQQIWPSHTAEDLESDSGLSLGSSPPLASPDGSVALIGYQGLDVIGAFREPHHHTPSYPSCLPPQAPPQTLRMIKQHGPCDISATPSRGSSHTKSVSHSSHLSRDERRALALKIPFPMEKIVNLPVDDFNELLTQYTLNDSQLALVRDIRRRGKNKVAAQNCRKRKLESIIHLERELGQLAAQREHLSQERREFQRSLAFLQCRLSDLYAQVFAHLRDENGRPYSMDEYSLQQTPDGKMYLVPFSRREPC
ncbi:transcription factor NF-E2 45 kDa subunit isoform X1 [Synchiropus splendidus]|uniref:transcription factor NF-E2 45 kDa subunit isoform X1 n=1 Tax=Synchiropus splendidus TaxID=270530 RepID=UPI00237D6705|nr:transcription factor NF-E2 45 kDa subunit isoform X1 [Synchiropus splendidus]XP_053704541.1 transcription factor NF-E2 45 kDa subunit isoform X1 [Synchiropus splendidus]XP_053704542.1 transcription factor NF-E2 45 kDa subunit isoform X1 [Synchiropus splendidus]